MTRAFLFYALNPVLAGWRAIIGIYIFDNKRDKRIFT
jgi:hypothetical protein